MTYRNLETIGKAIAYDMIDKNEKSLKLICKNYNISYNKLKTLIHDDTKVSLFKLDELKKFKIFLTLNLIFFLILIKIF